MFIQQIKKTIIFLIKRENIFILKTFLKINHYDKKEKIHVIGDSHTYIFDYINKAKLLKKLIYSFAVEAATVQGVLNPNSKTDAFIYFKRYIFWNVNKNDYLGILLGEVDCGFVIWYRSEKYQISVEKQLNLTIKKYEEFLLFLMGKGYKKIIIFSVPLPTIKDDDIHSDVANLRSEIVATQKQRTDLTIKFNKFIFELAVKYKLDYIDYSKDTSSSDTNLIDDVFLNKNVSDHHMDNKAFSKVIIPYLKKYIL